MLIAGYPYVPLISVIVGVTNLAPTFGPILGAVIGGLILLLINPLYALGFLIFTIILQTVDGYIKIYPRTFFSPYDYINGISYITENSYAIHHFIQSWLPKRIRMRTALKRKLVSIIGGENVKKIREKLT